MKKYKVLDSKNDLESYLKNLKSKKITIITAFASSVENLIDHLITKGNDVNLTIGTINSFTPPNIIEYCMNKKNNKLKLFVDFRYNKSTHWKIYLISPSTLIIGSANFTKIGISLDRDTCIVLNDKVIFNEYLLKVKELHSNPLVISSLDRKKFIRIFNEYKESHNKMQSSLIRSRKYDTIDKWLSNETNQSIPIFIWSGLHSKNTKNIAYDLIENDSNIDESETNIKNKDNIRDFFTSDQEILPYEQGDIVLCSDKKGTLSYIKFFTFDRIILHKGIYYIFSYKNPKEKYNIPFSITKKQKENIKKNVGQWYKNSITRLSREVIEKL